MGFYCSIQGGHLVMFPKEALGLSHYSMMIIQYTIIFMSMWVVTFHFSSSKFPLSSIAQVQGVAYVARVPSWRRVQIKDKYFGVPFVDFSSWWLCTCNIENFFLRKVVGFSLEFGFPRIKNIVSTVHGYLSMLLLFPLHFQFKFSV